eukprot:2097591-Amphidinium_carterae.1
MTENILETFQDAIASQFNFIPQALTVHSLSVTVTGEWKGGACGLWYPNQLTLPTRICTWSRKNLHMSGGRAKTNFSHKLQFEVEKPWNTNLSLSLAT